MIDGLSSLGLRSCVWEVLEWLRPGNMQVEWKRLKEGKLKQSGTPWELVEGTFR